MLWIPATFLKFLESKLILSFPQKKYVPMGLLIPVLRDGVCRTDYAASGQMRTIRHLDRTNCWKPSLTFFKLL